MKAAFYAGAAGLMAQQSAMDNIGNNLANVNTSGYKAQKVGFQDLLYRNMYVNVEDTPLTGSGTRVVDLGINYTQGTPVQTGIGTDFAIQGDGFFAVQGDDQVYYTRNGSFNIGLVNGVAYLTDMEGQYVLNAAGGRIQLPVDENGMPQTEGIIDQIGVFVVQNPAEMTPVSNNCYAANEQSGTVRVGIVNTDYILRQGALENSNVSMEDEMVQMILAQRAFQLNARVVQTADEIEQNVNNLR